MTRCATRRLQSGFTLLEVLVAMAIFSIVAYMAYGGLDAVLRQQQVLEASANRLRAVQFAVRQLSTDFGQIQPRSVREELGEGWKPALVADGRDLDSAELTRAGWSNPLGRHRSTLQRVAYRVEDGVLIRSYWPVLDRLLEQEGFESELLDGVESFELRFLDARGEWVDQWPASDLADDTPLLPRAVEIVLLLDDWGEISRIMEIPG